jgi:hypothetical protein
LAPTAPQVGKPLRNVAPRAALSPTLEMVSVIQKAAGAPWARVTQRCTVARATPNWSATWRIEAPPRTAWTICCRCRAASVFCSWQSPQQRVSCHVNREGVTSECWHLGDFQVVAVSLIPRNLAPGALPRARFWFDASGDPDFPLSTVWRTGRQLSVVHWRSLARWRRLAGLISLKIATSWPARLYRRRLCRRREEVERGTMEGNQVTCPKCQSLLRAVSGKSRFDWKTGKQPAGSMAQPAGCFS